MATNKTKASALVDFALETLRVGAIAVVAYLATDVVVNQLVDLIFGADLTPEIKFQVAALLTVILKSIDRALHESGIAAKGLTRF